MLFIKRCEGGLFTSGCNRSIKLLNLKSIYYFLFKKKSVEKLIKETGFIKTVKFKHGQLEIVYICHDCYQKNKAAKIAHELSNDTSTILERAIYDEINF